MIASQPSLNLASPASPFATLGPARFMRYGCILADPPWKFENFSEAGEEKNPVAHYPCMDEAAIAALPVDELAARDCWLVEWATAPMLDAAIRVLPRWGFHFVTAGAWAKESKSGAKIAFGAGYVRRSAAEFYIVGKRGEPKILPAAASIRNLIWAPVREHSRKPDCMHAECVASFPGPYVELFARECRPGWDAWGNQTTKFNGAA